MASPRNEARDAVRGVREGAKRLAIVDGEDYTAIRWDLIEDLDCRIYFKVSLVTNPLQVYVGGAPGLEPKRPETRARTRIVPFAMASTTPELATVNKDYDVCLLGGANWHGRLREGVSEDRPLLKPIYEERLRAEFPAHRLVMGKIPYEDFLATTNRSKIAVVLGGHGIEPLRTYESMSCPGTLIVRAENDHLAPAPLVHGTHCATFDSVDNMVEHVRFYLEHEDERRRIAANGNALVRDHYTPRARARQLLSEAFA